METKDVERFWSKVVKSDGCWNWSAAVANGMGVFSFGGKGKQVKAAKFSWEMVNGLVPEGKVVYRTCGNRLCVRPDHLAVGTMKEVIGHSCENGKRKKYKNGGKSRLSTEQIIKIREMAGNGCLDEELARLFNISRSYVNNIVTNKNYFPHIPMGPARPEKIYDRDILSEKNRERFWSKVAKKGEDECWNWTGTTHHNGYGVFKCGRKMHIASRLCWILMNGEIQKKLFACHKCDNPICVNPNHIFLGTARDNNKDRANKGRSYRRITSNKKKEIKIKTYKKNPNLSKDYIDKFWSKVIKRESGCWEWGGNILKPYKNGNLPYGTFSVFIDGKQISYMSHRLSWMITKGDIPEGMMVCHKCDNSICCNPDHLFIGTNDDNMKDMVNKNRQAFGEKAGRSKLVEEDVIKIRMRYKNGETSTLLGKEYGVSCSTICAMCEVRSWKSLKQN